MTYTSAQFIREVFAHLWLEQLCFVLLASLLVAGLRCASHRVEHHLLHLSCPLILPIIRLHHLPGCLFRCHIKLLDESLRQIVQLSNQHAFLSAKAVDFTPRVDKFFPEIAVIDPLLGHNLLLKAKFPHACCLLTLRKLYHQGIGPLKLVYDELLVLNDLGWVRKCRHDFCFFTKSACTIVLSIMKLQQLMKSIRN